MTSNRTFTGIFLLFALTTLAGCGGGGGGGGSSEPSAAVITVQPADQSVVEGGTATFTVVASNATGYQWQSSTDGGINFANIASATHTTLTRAAVALSDDGQHFRVVVSNAVGNVTSNAATLTVYPLPNGIGNARAAADGVTNLPITGATVTYLKPQIGDSANDPAGFTIQESLTGPALFVAVDPTTLTPSAAVGDIVSFTITQMGTVGLQRRALAISNYTLHAINANIAALAQNISTASDLVTAVDQYESEIVTVSGSIFSNFSASGTDFQSAGLTTTGSVADANLRLRAPATLVDSLDLVNGCQITATHVPVGRFNTQTQIGVFSAAELALSNCPAPTVESAVALSATTVQITFTRNILPASVLANSSQFTFDNGLVAQAVTVNGRTVTVTTSVQTGSINYLVSVANTVTDLQGTALGLPSTAQFFGFVTPAVVRINEFNANITNGCDLIELRVIVGGSMNGFRLQARDAQALVTFGNLVVATNDLVVVHMNSNVTCNVNGATQETTAKNQQPSANYAGNYDSAWDVWSAGGGLANTDNVFTLYNPANAIVDAVFTANLATGTAAVGTEAQAAAVAAASQWQMVGGGIPVGGFVDDGFRAHAALDLDATDASATGTSIQRLDNTDDNDKDDWNSATVTVQAQTFGAINNGQTPF